MTKQEKQQINNVRSKIRWGIVGILVLLLMTSVYDAPGFVNRTVEKINTTTGIGLPTVPEKAFRLGLDLQGGAHLVYEADVSDIIDSERGAAVEGVRDVIERRVNALGVGEPTIQTAKVGEDYRINVDLPGVSDVNEAIRRIGETPILEFREENNDPPRELTAEEQVELDEQNAGARARVAEAYAALGAGDSFEDVVQAFSEDDASKVNNGYIGFIQDNDIKAELYDWAESAAEGDVSPTAIASETGLSILQRGGQQEGSPFVTASHILFCYPGAQNCINDRYGSKEQALAQAQDVFARVNKDNFEELAKEFSTEPGIEATGGNLGEIGEGITVPAFEKPLFEAAVGDIIGPVETPFGYHIIYKEDERIPLEYELSQVFFRLLSEEDILPPQDPFKRTGLSGKQLERAQVVTDHQSGQVQVSLQFDAEGTELFREITETHVGEPIAIFLDGEPISIPTVQIPITNGQAVITGSFTLPEAQLLSQRLNAGALPVPVELIGQQTIGASLGAESLEKSLKAGGLALVLVMIFMLLYYRLPGLLSIVALSLYLSLTLAIFKLIGVTLTLAGIAGLILSIGMAVDANVLIFERLKEELKKGKSLRIAVEEGFQRAWSAIKDGNISTIITCVLLIWFGSSFVQGFAFTLAVGVLVSMFSAITVTRVMLRFIVPWFDRANWMFLGARKK